ncbi:MAG: 30S ribosomal protein S16 [Calditrichota bacterium]
MAVRLRLTRMGRKKRPFYRIVAVDSRVKRDGAYIEKVGYYHPLDEPPTIVIDGDKALKWLRDGAQPSNTVVSLLRREGVWLRFRLEKRGLPETQINDMMADWFAKHKPAAAPAPVIPTVEAAVSEPEAAVEEAVPEPEPTAETENVSPEPEPAEETPAEV